MNQKEIRQQVITFQELKDRCYKEITSLQEKCKHPNKKVTHESNTGNYDPSCDSYWDVCSCFDCQKSWVERK